MEDLKLVIVGHVDHGKSTLIGRLLYDTHSVPEDKVKDVEKKCQRLGKDFEYAFLLDALEEEQEQNITIDTTETYFRSSKKNYVIIDAPGHKDFIKNMVTGSSSADAAILVVDAQEGLKEQTTRHSYLLKLLGINDVIVVINKMDLVQFSEARFGELKEKIITLLLKMDLSLLSIVPISAREGDNVMKPSPKMTWYKGKTILETLNSYWPDQQKDTMLRFPVQDVYRWDGKRIIAGRIESGKLNVGEAIVFSPSLKEIKVKSIEKWNSGSNSAEAGDSIGITMEEQIFIERGEIASLEDQKPAIVEEFKANVFWLGNEPLRLHKKYLLKLTTQERECEIVLIKKRVNSSTLEVLQESGAEVLTNEVAEVIISTTKPIVLDSFKLSKNTGRFVLVDNYDVAGGGIVIEPLESNSRTYTS